MLHELKIRTHYFNEVLSGRKKYEVRKDDREYNCGDYLLLKELSNDNWLGEFSGQRLLVKVTNIMRDKEYVKDEHVIMSIDVLDKIKC